MDDIKLFAKKTKTKKELEILIQVVKIYSQNTGVKFGIEKCAILITRSRNWQMTEGIELPNQEKIRTLGEKETFKNLEILEAGTIKQDLPYKTPGSWTATSDLTSYSSKTNKTCKALLVNPRSNSLETFTCGLPYIDAPVLTNQQRLKSANMYLLQLCVDT